MEIPLHILALPGFDATFSFPPIPDNQTGQLLIDKIGLRCSRAHINTLIAEQFYSFKPINIMIWGDCVQINIHPEWWPACPHLGARCMTAIDFLLENSLFTGTLEWALEMIDLTVTDLDPSRFHESLKALGSLFTLMEWETALDFYDHPITKLTSSEDFHIHKGTIYSNDYRQFTVNVPQVNSDGIILPDAQLSQHSTGRRLSFIKIYPRHLKVGTTRPYYRLEFRHHGENAKKDLYWDLLNGTTVMAYLALIPSICLIIRQLTRPNHFQFADIWLQFPTPELEFLLKSLDWFNPGLANSPIKPRRPRTTKRCAVPWDQVLMNV